MHDLAKVSARRKPYSIIIHCGSNDFNNMNETTKTIEHMEEVFTHIIKETPKTQIAYSLTFKRYDKLSKNSEVHRRIKDTNEQMKVLCRRYGVKVISNDNMGRSLLDYYKGWHPNANGKDLLKKNWGTFIHTV